MKKCNICEIIKPFTEFHKHKHQKDGYNTICKECRKPISLKYREDNRDVINKKRSDDYYRNHEYYLIKDRERIKNEREKRKLSSKNYAKLNSEKIKEYRKKYYQKNKNKIIKKSTEWCKTNKEKCLKNISKRLIERKKEDILFKLKTKLKTDIYISLKRQKRNKRIDEILGITIFEFKEYIEKQFENWMSWENWGLLTWHIDHIIPLSSAKDIDELYKLWHYTNMRPLSASENLKKSNKLIF
jgi:hypothetical protein